MITVKSILFSAMAVYASRADIEYKTLYDKSIQKLLENISPLDSQIGTIVASPSRISPDYYYHWIRDGSIAYQSLVNDGHQKTELLLNFASITSTHQKSIAHAGLGEPKFYINGTVYDGAWTRPQNDGPALRALTLVKFAEKYVLNGGDFTHIDWFYSIATPATSIIKKDLDFIVQNWHNSCYDLWQEVYGDHFYTRMVQQAALEAGVRIATRYNDIRSATIYTNAMKNIRLDLVKFWNRKKMSLIATWGRMEIDTSLILACLHSRQDSGWTEFACSGSKMLSTMAKLVEVFKKEYPINQGMIVPLIGRYPGDKYDGKSRSKGNPWIPATFAVAEFLYQVANEFHAKKSINIKPTNQAFYQTVLGMTVKIRRYSSNECQFYYILRNLTLKGDQYIDRVLEYTSLNDNSFSEQINGVDGKVGGARDLSWSYASFITAHQARQHVGFTSGNLEC